jgi:single-stranded-DNA-specific exonuclease
MRVIYREKNQSVADYTRSKGLDQESPLLAYLLSTRLSSPEEVESFMAADLRSIPDPILMDQMGQGANRLAQAVQNEELIWIVSDFDNDGIGGMAVVTKILRDYFGVKHENIYELITQRYRGGYGFTQSAIDLMLEERRGMKLPDLLITIDLGSANGKEIASAQQVVKGLDAIVTDHHHVPPEGYPQGINAFINPNKPSCNYPDKTICGATVAFLLMVATKKELERQGVIEAGTSIAKELSYAASSTIADCVSMRSPANRAIVKYGLSQMNGYAKPAWQALDQHYSPENPMKVSSDTLGWKLGPLINSNSRMGLDGKIPLQFFLADTPMQAKELLDQMVSVNEERKELKEDMYQSVAGQLEQQSDDFVQVGYLDEGKAGISGILASKIKEETGKPTFVFTKGNDVEATGSGRSIEGVDLFAILHEIEAESPGILVRFGGHPAAAGATIKIDNIKAFKQAFEKKVAEKVDGEVLEPVHVVDGQLGMVPINRYLMEQIKALEPFGQKFEKPKFTLKGCVQKINLIGKKAKVHARIKCQTQSLDLVDIMYFFILKNEGDALPFTEGQTIEFVVEMGENFFRGDTSIQIIASDHQNA